MSLVDDTRHGTAERLAAGGTALEVAGWAARVRVHECVGLAAGSLGTAVTALLWRDAKDRGDVVAEKVDVGQLFRALGWRGHTLVVVRVPWLAVEARRTARRATFVATRAPLWRRASWRLGGDDRGRYRADHLALLTPALLEVTGRAAVTVVVDERVGLAPGSLGTTVTAARRLETVDRLEILSKVVDANLLSRTLWRRWDTLVVERVPRLAVVSRRAARGTFTVATTLGTSGGTGWRRRVDDRRHRTRSGTLLTSALLEVTHCTTIRVEVDERVSLAASSRTTLVAALLRNKNRQAGDIVAEVVDADFLLATLGIDTAALVVRWVPWLTVLALRTLGWTDLIVTTITIGRRRWGRRGRCWCSWLRRG